MIYARFCHVDRENDKEKTDCNYGQKLDIKQQTT